MLSPTILKWLDAIAKEDAGEGEEPNRSAAVRRMIRQERERRAGKTA